MYVRSECVFCLSINCRDSCYSPFVEKFSFNAESAGKIFASELCGTTLLSYCHVYLTVFLCHDIKDFKRRKRHSATIRTCSDLYIIRLKKKLTIDNLFRC